MFNAGNNRLLSDFLSGQIPQRLLEIIVTNSPITSNNFTRFFDVYKAGNERWALTPASDWPMSQNASVSFVDLLFLQVYSGHNSPNCQQSAAGCSAIFSAQSTLSQLRQIAEIIRQVYFTIKLSYCSSMTFSDLANKKIFACILFTWCAVKIFDARWRITPYITRESRDKNDKTRW